MTTPIPIALHEAAEEIGFAIGVAPDDLAEALALGAVEPAVAARRLEDCMALWRRIAPRFETHAEAWRRAVGDALPGFGGRTALDLVREGRLSEALVAVDAVDAGVYA